MMSRFLTCTPGQDPVELGGARLLMEARRVA
jgi:hypothetical protein